MAWQNVLSIALGVALGNLLLAYHARFRAWKADRSEIPAYRNWRGEYVPDLHFIRVKRALIASWVLFLVVGFIFSYFVLTGYRPY